VGLPRAVINCPAQRCCSSVDADRHLADDALDSRSSASRVINYSPFSKEFLWNTRIDSHRR
jgi:hypothetical protein